MSYVLVTKSKHAQTWSFILWDGLGTVIAAFVCPVVGMEITLFDLNFEGIDDSIKVL